MHTELRHFLSLADAGNITTAAASLGITQSALSKSLKRLEEFVGVPLVTRLPRGVVLNDAGRMVYKRASSMEAEMRYLGLDARNERTRQQKVLRIGAGPLWSVVFLPRIVERFRKSHPDVVLSIQVGPKDTLLDLLSEAAIDIAICATDGRAPDTELLVETLMEVELQVACGISHPLLHSWNGDKANLLEQDWVVYQSAPGHSTQSHKVVPVKELGNPNAVVYTSSWLGGLTMTAQGSYLMNLPVILRDFVEPLGIRFLTSSPSIPSFSGGLWSRRSVTTTEVGKAFRAIAREQILKSERPPLPERK